MKIDFIKKFAHVEKQHDTIHFSAYQLSLLGFLAMIIIGTLLLLIPGMVRVDTSPLFLTAVFEATSAVCVTGLSVVDISTYYSLAGQICLLLLIQLGGLGYMTLYSLMLFAVGKRLSLHDRFALQETLDLSGAGKVTQFLLRILIYSLFFEGLGTLLLMLRWVPQYGLGKGFYFSIFHSISAFNNAGFSLFPDSLMTFSDDPIILTVIACLILMGGLGFPVIWELSQMFRKHKLLIRWSKISFHSRVSLLMTGLFFFGGGVIYLLLEFHNSGTVGSMPLGTRVLNAFFMSVMPRTAGFNSLDVSQLTQASIFLTLSLMLIGANPGGTGGGIKTTTIVAIFTQLWADLRGQKDSILFRRRLSPLTIRKAWATVILSIMWINLITLLLTITEQNRSFLSLIFEVVSAFATVGMSTGITANLSVMGQLLVILTMYIGRVGILSAGMAFVGKSRASLVKYPEDSLMVG